MLHGPGPVSMHKGRRHPGSSSPTPHWSQQPSGPPNANNTTATGPKQQQNLQTGLPFLASCSLLVLAWLSCLVTRENGSRETMGAPHCPEPTLPGVNALFRTQAISPLRPHCRRNASSRTPRLLHIQPCLPISPRVSLYRDQKTSPRISVHANSNAMV